MTKIASKTAVERNLTTKALGIDGKALVDAAIEKLGKDPAAEKIAAIRIAAGVMYGIITQVKPQIDGKTGEVRAVLIGQFEGINAVTGEVVRSARCYIPQVQETLEADFNALPANVRGQRMKFRADLYVVHNEDRYGFRYAVELPLRDTNSDPLADMRKELDFADVGLKS